MNWARLNGAQLAIEISALAFQLSQRLGRRTIARRRVEAVARQRLDLATVHARMNAIAVELARAARRPERAVINDPDH